MTPNFALSLSFDGIRLLHRVPGGWHLVGEVAVDAPNLAQEIAVLRRTALALDPSGLRTKVLIPNDQIKYLSLDGTRATEDDIYRAIEGATPYALSELVIDYSRGGGRTHIAAVPRETLAEAEAFAVENRLGPVCFAAIPVPFTYHGEVFFGRSEAAIALLGPGETVGRDNEPVKIIGATHLPTPPVAAPTPIVPDRVPDPIEVKELAAEDPAETTAPALETQAVSTSELPQALIETGTAESETSTIAAAEFDLADTAPAETDVLATAEVVSESVETSSTTAPEVTLPAADLTDLLKEPAVPQSETAPIDAVDTDINLVDEAASGPAFPPDAFPSFAETAQPVIDALVADPGMAVEFASRSRTLRADDTIPPAPPVPAPSAPARSTGEPAFSSRHRNGDNAASKTRREPPVLAVQTGLGAKVPLGAASPEPTVAVPVISVMSPDPVIAPPVTGRAPVPVDPQPPAVLPEITLPASVPADLNLSVQDEVSAAVAAPSSQPAAPPKSGGLFQSSRKQGKGRPEVPPVPPEEEAARLTVFGARRRQKDPAVGGKPRNLLLILMVLLVLFMAAVALLASRNENGLAGLLGLTTETEIPIETASDPGAVAVPVAIPAEEPASGQTNTAATIEALAAAVASASGTDGASTSSQTAVGSAASEDVAALSEDASQTGADTGLLTPAEAERLYAETGVWQRAPRLPLVPRTEADPAVTPAGAETVSKAERAQAELPEPGLTAPDPVLAAQILPPPAGTTFARDSRGFILATAEGTVLPDGLVVFAGAPVIRPPTRPVAAVAPEVDLTTEDPAAPLDPTSPEIAAELALATAAEPESALAGGPRPRLRPESLQPPAPPEAEAPADAAVDLALASARPRVRPVGLAPLAAVEPEAAADPVVDTAGPGDAAALAASAASTVDVAAIADAIAATAPAVVDPVAGATQIAPAASDRPDTRPRNFNRVVQAARAAPAAAIAEPEIPETEPTPARNTTVAPSGPVPGGVANAATDENAINLRDLTLLGVSGSQGDRRALVRQPNGRVLTVTVGDRLDGGQVTAIDEHALNYVKRGRTLTLEVGG